MSREGVLYVFGWFWDRLLKDIDIGGLETKAALQRRAFLLAERVRSKSAAQPASLVPMARPEVRRRLMPADKMDTV